ncbi:MAG: TauD/TfdA family dioxygenase [Rhodospirillales bacterium]|nr:TauD/TfdA family dioxygenase [Rhodospirillales bacterium]
MSIGGAPKSDPFDLDSEVGFRRWREQKLAVAPTQAEDLIVEIANLGAPTAAERAKAVQLCRQANMAVYASASTRPADKQAIRRFAAAFGLRRLDANVLADDDGVTPIHAAEGGTRARYVPYTERAISWHTDGYYNAPDRQVRGMVLHCTRPAAVGGESALMDPEIAYILLRDRDPRLVAALMRPDAMTIPANDEEGLTRPERSGPVFSLDARGALHMRYTARARNVVWLDDPEVRRAVAALEALLAGDSPYIIRHRLTAGQGLLCNNVLHNRSAFSDAAGGAKRLLYRARFFERVAGT